jgi:hypothetical protein
MDSVLGESFSFKIVWGKFGGNWKVLGLVIWLGKFRITVKICPEIPLNGSTIEL